VAYLEARPRAHEGPFLIEERHLIETVAERLASVFLRRVAEDRLRDSEDRFRKLFEDTAQAITLVDDGRFVAANAASLAMLRIDRLEDLLGRTPVDISPPFQLDGRASAEKVADVIRTTFETGSNQFEWEHLRADGEQFTARVLTTAIRQGGKDLLHVVWTDITAQKQAEAELAEYRHDLERKVAERTAEVIAATESLRIAHEERQAVFDAASVGIVLTRDRVIVHCNRTMERMLGREAGELTGQLTRIWYRTDAEYAAAGERIYADIERQGFHQRGDRAGPQGRQRVLGAPDGEGGRSRSTGAGRRRHHRGHHHRARRHRRDGAGARTRRGRRPDQVRLPREHESRDPDADERRHRDDASRAEDRAHAAAARVRPEDPVVEPDAAGHPERHPGLLEDRRRQARRGAHRFRARPRARQRRRDGRRAHGRQGGSS
jgi:PAS domain S-box-containing protein